MLSTELKKGQFLSSAGKIGIVTDIFFNEDRDEYRIVFKSADSILRYATDSENIPFLNWCTHEVNLNDVLLDIETKKLQVTKIENSARLLIKEESLKKALYCKVEPCYFVASDGDDVFAKTIYGTKMLVPERLFSEIEESAWIELAEKHLTEKTKDILRKLKKYKEELSG